MLTQAQWNRVHHTDWWAWAWAWYRWCRWGQRAQVGTWQRWRGWAQRCRGWAPARRWGRAWPGRKEVYPSQGGTGNVAREEFRFSNSDISFSWKRKTETVAVEMKSEVRKNSDLKSNWDIRQGERGRGGISQIFSGENFWGCRLLRPRETKEMQDVFKRVSTFRWGEITGEILICLGLFWGDGGVCRERQRKLEKTKEN